MKATESDIVGHTACAPLLAAVCVATSLAFLSKVAEPLPSTL
jgi:hypothetical protein